jgi:hypothetical protein
MTGLPWPWSGSERSGGRLEDWKTGRMEEWKTGRLESRGMGALEWDPQGIRSDISRRRWTWRATTSLPSFHSSILPFFHSAHRFALLHLLNDAG